MEFGGPSLLELWYDALRSPLGLVLETNDTERLRSELYKVRTAADDPQLAALSILVSPANPTGELWIVHRDYDSNPGLTEDLSRV